MTALSTSTTGIAGLPGEIDWGAALREHSPWLRMVIRSRLNESQAVEDLLQEVSLAVLKSRVRPADPSKVAPWLYRVSIKQCLMYRRSAGRRRKLVDRVARDRPTISGEACDPLRWLLGRERQGSIQAAFDALPELDRQILILKHAENWSYRQLADRLGVSLNTVEYRLLQARKRLRTELDRASESSESSHSRPGEPSHD
ncbi:MAG: RNA polymerase sigma factor [Planctomycetota bacterium]|nr:MAG: RNA polymerase sigma factor [Planctomycetota bacterium]